MSTSTSKSATSDDGGLSLLAWKEIDAVCTRYEAACRAGHRCDPTDFLGEVDGPARDRLLRELLAIDLEARKRHGEARESAEHDSRFQHHSTSVDSAIEGEIPDGFTQASRPRKLRGRKTTTGGGQLTHISPVLAPAELSPVVTEALRSAGYEVLGELGRGGMGVVYLARKIALNRLCALKMILAGAHAGSVAHARFRAEAEAIAKLRHPDIVQIYHVGEADGLPYLELEYLSGGGLDQALSGLPKPAATAAALVEVMARAIAEAHHLGIIHRDLKPANVLLDSNGRPKVADFGLAKILGSEGGLTRSSAVLGSPSYMAPEQAEGDASKIGPRTDVYSLGAILYELLSGRPPFRAATALETLAHVKDADPVAPSKIQPGMPGDIETICLKCLEKQPLRRYATALDLAEDLRRFQAGEPILAQDPPMWLLLWKRARRRPALSAALLVTAAAVVLLIGGSLYYNAQLRESVRKAQAAERAALDQSSLTKKTLNELVFGVQDQLGKTAATRDLRKGLLDTALDGLDQVALIAESAAPDLSRAAAHQKLGDILRQVGRTDEALRQYEYSRSLSTQLAAAAPGDLATAQCLARSHAGLAELSLNADKPKEAVEHCLQVVLLAEKTAESNPDKTQARAAMIEAYFRLGRAYHFDRDLAQGEVWFRKMESLAERWIAEEPGNVFARDQLATSHRKIADLRKLDGDDVAASAIYVKAVDLGQKLHTAEPTNSEVKLHLALALDDQAMTLKRLGLLEEASPLERQSEQLFNELVSADIEDVDNRVRLYQTQFNRGTLELDLLDPKAAAARFRKALEGLTSLDREGKLLGRPRDRKQLLEAFQVEITACEAVAAVPADLDVLRSYSPKAAARLLRIHAGLLLAAGRPGELPATIDALCAVDAHDPEELFQLARALAWCAGRLDNLTRSDAAAKAFESQKTRLTDRALAFLEKAVSAGLRHPDRLEHDAFLAPIRNRGEFRALTESRRKGDSESGTSPSRDSQSATTQIQKL